MKTVYLFDEATGEYTTIYEAQESPLEPGEYITPAASTDIEPPEPLEGHARCFIEGAWQQVTDNRGTWYTSEGEEVHLESLLDTLNPTWTRELPAPSADEQMKAAVEAVRLALQNAIDIKAKGFGFSGGNALMLYAGFSNPFHDLAIVFATWEASVWVEADEYKAQVIAGEQPMLSPAEAVAMIPTYPGE